MGGSDIPAGTQQDLAGEDEMRTARVVTCLVLAAILPQRNGCVHMDPLLIQSFPRTPEAARASDEFEVV